MDLLGDCVNLGDDTVIQLVYLGHLHGEIGLQCEEYFIFSISAYQGV